MRKTITIKGNGATVAQARTTAYAALKAHYKNNILVYGLIDTKEIVAPKPGKQCTTLNNPPVGTRKWETKYTVYAISPATGEKKLFETLDDKTSAVKKAKEIALAHQVKVEVCIEKLQTNLGQANLPAGIAAVIEPKMTPGTWEFTLDVEVVA